MIGGRLRHALKIAELYAGGILVETTHKFFMQFVFYTALYTTYVWITTAILLAERISKVASSWLSRQ